MTPVDYSEAPAASCVITETRAADTARITLRVRAEHACSGRYSIKLSKLDSAGSATLMQNGRFDVEVGDERKIGELTTSVSPTGEIVLDGRVEIEGRSIVCRTVRTDSL